MAAIQSLRKNSWILTLVIGLALLAFIVTGLDTSLFSSGKNNIVAEIDGTEYSYDEYSTIVEQLEEQQKNATSNLSYAQKEKVYSEAWRSFLTGKLFEKNYTELGLSTYKKNLGVQGISDEEIQDVIIGENIDPELQYYFRNPQTGQFDKDMLINVLSNLSTYKQQNPEFYESWIQLEKSLHENMLRRKYVSLVANSIYTTTLEAEDNVKNKNEQFDVDYIRIPYESINDSTIALTDKELEKYYTTINTEKRFQQEAGVSLEYVTFDIIPTQKDIEDIKNAVLAKSEDFKNSKNDNLFLNLNSDIKYTTDYNKKGALAPALDSFAFSSNIGDVTSIYLEDNSYKIAKVSDIRLGADSAKVRHILVNGERAYEVVDSLKKLVETGANFGDLAKKHSIDSVSAINGGVIDWFKEGEMVKSFQDSSFFGNVNSLYIVPSNYGVHLVQVLEQGPKSKRVQVQVFAKAITYSQSTRSTVYQNAVKFISKNRTKEQFENAIDNNKNLVLKYANNTEENQRVIVGIDESRQIIRWAHQNKETINTVSDIFRCGNSFVIAVITNVEEKGPMAFENVKDAVAEDLKLEKKKEIILNNLKSEDCSSLEALAKANNVNIEKSANLSFAAVSGQGIGIEPVLFATLSLQENGTITKPVAGERGVFVAKVTNKHTAELTDAIKEQSTLKQRSVSTLTNNIYKILEEKAEIVDNRINFN